MLIWKLVYLFRGFLVGIPLIFAAFWFHGETENVYVIWPVGLFVFFIGMAIRIWAQQHLRYRLKIHKELTLTGPYQFVRNPVYIGTIMIFLGMTILFELPWLVPVTLIWSAAIYSLVIHYEELHLLARYGEPYKKFMSDIPRWIPRNLSLGNLGLKNEYFTASVVAELFCLMYLLPCLLKELISIWYKI
jgi:protein-S-isoprenylcysteine O-methyltransferase Ste14